MDADDRKNLNSDFKSLFKLFPEPGVNDVVVMGVLRVELINKYQYHLSDDEFYTVGDELAEGGYFRWNDDGKRL